MGVSKNRATPKWMEKKWKTLLRWDNFGGYHSFGKHPSIFCLMICMKLCIIICLMYIEMYICIQCRYMYMYRYLLGIYHLYMIVYIYITGGSMAFC